MSQYDSGYTMKVSWEQVDSIIINELSQCRDGLQDSLKERLQGEGTAIFDRDPDKDIALIRDRIRCFEQVLDYYGVQCEV